MHPYTEALFAAIPDIDTDIDNIKTLEGNVPSSINPPPGCKFHTRCQFAKEICSRTEPETVILDDGRTIACHKINNTNF